MSIANMIKWIKIQIIEPQLNKAIKKSEGHKAYSDSLKEEYPEINLRSRKVSNTIKEHETLAEIYYSEKLKLQDRMNKLKKI